MAQNYSTKLHTDRAGQPMQEFAGFDAIQTDSSDNNAVSSIVSFNANTVSVEVGTAGAGAAIKWLINGDTSAATSVITAAGTANFDHYIPPNAVRRFVVPMETQGVSSIVGANIQNGLFRRMAVKSVGAASVLTTQYSPNGNA